MAGFVGQSVDRYHILEQLGEGGMAIVYKAYDTRLERDVALKVIRTEKLTLDTMSRSLKRFEREAKSLGKLTHPNIVPISDYGEYEGKPYLVMPYLPGGTLKAKLGKPMQWNEAVELILPIAEALAYAHSQHMIHRDVKPSNILLTQSGRPMLTDFGIAKILDLEETQELTGTSAAIGTPEYMAPEQAHAKTVDHRADIYALGIVLYEMVTGRKPFIADTPMAVLVMHIHDPLPSPRKFAPSLSERAEKILTKALAKKPENRYQTMEEMYAALKNVGQNAILSRAAEKPRKEQTATITEPTAHEVKRAVAASTVEEKTIRETPPASATRWRKIRTFLFRLLLVIVPIAFIVGCVWLSGYVLWKEGIAYSILYPPLPTYTPATGTLPNQITDSQGITMRLVPAGTFTMGSDDIYDAQPVHDVYLDDYYMDIYEVTNALYKTCVEEGVCDPPENTGDYNNSTYKNHPVVYVDWYMAQTYCEWRGGSLPTEAQWEKAARGTDAVARTYPWGEGIDPTRANYYDYSVFSSNIGDTTAVGSYPKGISPYGLYDMAGNAWEWVLDWYDLNYYSNSPSGNPQGPATGQYRVLRGGSWNNVDYLARSADRSRLDPSVTNSSFGFRCSRSLP